MTQSTWIPLFLAVGLLFARGFRQQILPKDFVRRKGFNTPLSLASSRQDQAQPQKVPPLTKKNDRPMPAWFYRDEEEIVIDESEDGAFTFTQSDFDSLSSLGDNSNDIKKIIDVKIEKSGEVGLENVDDGKGGDKEYSSAQLTLRDISESLQFSLNFLGDFVVQMGIDPPINVDMKLGDMMTGEQIYTLLQAVNTLDPFDSDSGYYEGLSVEEVAEELDIDLDTIIKIAEKERLNLPFGLRTVLHASAVEKIRSVYEFDRDQLEGEDDGEEDEDDEDDIDDDNFKFVNNDSVIDVEFS